MAYLKYLPAWNVDVEEMDLAVLGHELPWQGFSQDQAGQSDCPTDLRDRIQCKN